MTATMRMMAPMMMAPATRITAMVHAGMAVSADAEAPAAAATAGEGVTEAPLDRLTLAVKDRYARGSLESKALRMAPATLSCREAPSLPSTLAVIERSKAARVIPMGAARMT